jgi:pantoate--beta-alanine ligase
VFFPDVETIYPPGAETRVSLDAIPKHLCGLDRPHHFGGVATVVTGLLNIVQPDLAVFGEKDFQQLQVIRRLVRDLHLPVEIVGAPIAREADGLAMSSRNAYLSPDERRRALALSTALSGARAAADAGVRDPRQLEAARPREVRSTTRPSLTRTRSTRRRHCPHARSWRSASAGPGSSTTQS